MVTIGIYKLPSGRKVEVELERPHDQRDSNEFEPAGPGRAAQKVIEATLDLKDSVASIAELSDSLLDGLVGAARRPEEIALEISLKVGASGNLIIAGGSVEGSIKIGLKYKVGVDTVEVK